MKMYRVTVLYEGHDVSKDRRIEEVVGEKHFEGSGFEFRNGERELTFTFRAKKQALKAAARVRNSVHGVRAHVELDHEPPDGYEEEE